MKYAGTLIAVSNMGQSIKFYQEVLGLKVIADFGANVTLEGGVFLQTLESWKEFIRTDQVAFENNAWELYFEEKDFEGFVEHLKTFDISYIHKPITHDWGQRAVRFYDMDYHIIEVAEEINSVVKRFISSGMSIEETAVRMDVPVEYIEMCLQL